MQFRERKEETGGGRGGARRQESREAHEVEWRAREGLCVRHGSVCRAVDLSLTGRADQSVGSGAER